MAAAVEPVSGGHPGGRGDRGYAAESGPGGFGPNPVDVVAGDDEQLGGGIGAETERVDQLGGQGGGELGE
jgi:hypothetical protein